RGVPRAASGLARRGVAPAVPQRRGVPRAALGLGAPAAGGLAPTQFLAVSAKAETALKRLFPRRALPQLAAADNSLVLEQVDQRAEGAALCVDRPLQPDDQRLQLLQRVLRRAVRSDDRDLILVVRLQH